MPHYTSAVALPDSTPDYIPPRHSVLLLSCMDARLIDELADLMSRDNLTNRYDHVVLAGASLGALQEEYPHWREVFFDHLRLAIELHQIRDVYIVEHRNCGAYRRFLGKDYDDSPADQAREEHDHRTYAMQLHDLVRERFPELQVRCFLMDLRGRATTLFADTSGPAKGSASPTAKAARPKAARTKKAKG